MEINYLSLMKSIAAIVAGSLFIVIVSLILQLAYVLIAVEYVELVKTFPVLNEIKIYIRYLVGIPVFMLVMFAGGLVTADIVQSRVVLHCFIVGLITAGGMLWMSLTYMEMTLSGMVVFMVSLAITMAGGLYWQRSGETVNA